MGELPKGWEWKRLGDVTNNFDEKRIPLKAEDRKKISGIYPYYGASGIIDYVNDFLYDGDYLLIGEDGANLIARSTPIAFKASGKFWVNNHAHVIQPKENVALGFLEKYLNLIDLKKYVTGSAQPKITQKNLDRIEIPLPPLHIQRQIVAILEQAEAARRQRQEADALTGALLQSVFFEMFGNPVTNERGWPLHKMKNVCKKITDGTHDTPEPTFSGVPFIMGKHIRDRIIDFPNSLFVSKNVHDEIYRRCNPQQGDVILVHIGANLGNAAFISVPFEFSMKNIALLKPNPSLINGRYLESYLIFTKQNTKKIVSRGGAQQFMSIKEMELIPCLLPPLALQQQFARVVQDVERVREQQVASGKEIEGLCEGLMARAFAGGLAAN